MTTESSDRRTPAEGAAPIGPQETAPSPGSTVFDHVLRDAIAARGLALTRLRDHLESRGEKVGVSTLSYWQNGERHPTAKSLPVIAVLEEVLELPTGTLTSLVPREGHRMGRSGRMGRVIGYADTVNRLVAEMQTVSPHQVTPLAVTEGLTFGADGAFETKFVHQVVRATSDTDRQIFAHQGEEGGDPRLLHIEAVSGCRLGRTAVDFDQNLLVGELLYDRTLRRHETHVVQFAIKDGNQLPVREYYRVFITRGGLWVAEMTFDPACRPVRIEEFYRRHLEDRDLRSRPVSLYDGNRAHVVVENGTPGVAGLAWEFE